MGRFDGGDHRFTSRMVGLNVFPSFKRRPIGHEWGAVQEEPFKTAVEEWRAQAKGVSMVPGSLGSIAYIEVNRPLVVMPSMPHRLAHLLPAWVEDPDPMQALINEMGELNRAMARASWLGDSDYWTIKFGTPNMEANGPPPNDDWHNRTKLERMRPCRRPEAKAAAMKQWHEDYVKHWPGTTHLRTSI